jgi:hypothetical protein
MEETNNNFKNFLYNQNIIKNYFREKIGINEKEINYYYDILKKNKLDDPKKLNNLSQNELRKLFNKKITHKIIKHKKFLLNDKIINQCNDETNNVHSKLNINDLSKNDNLNIMDSYNQLIQIYLSKTFFDSKCEKVGLNNALNYDNLDNLVDCFRKLLNYYDHLEIFKKLFTIILNKQNMHINNDVLIDIITTIPVKGLTEIIPKEKGFISKDIFMKIIDMLVKHPILNKYTLLNIYQHIYEIKINEINVILKIDYLLGVIKNFFSQDKSLKNSNVIFKKNFKIEESLEEFEDKIYNLFGRNTDILKGDNLNDKYNSLLKIISCTDFLSVWNLNYDKRYLEKYVVDKKTKGFQGTIIEIHFGRLIKDINEKKKLYGTCCEELYKIPMNDPRIKKVIYKFNKISTNNVENTEDDLYNYIENNKKHYFHCMTTAIINYNPFEFIVAFKLLEKKMKIYNSFDQSYLMDLSKITPILNGILNTYKSNNFKFNLMNIIFKITTPDFEIFVDKETCTGKIPCGELFDYAFNMFRFLCIRNSELKFYKDNRYDSTAYAITKYKLCQQKTSDKLNLKFDENKNNILHLIAENDHKEFINNNQFRIEEKDILIFTELLIDKNKNSDNMTPLEIIFKNKYYKKKSKIYNMFESKVKHLYDNYVKKEYRKNKEIEKKIKLEEKEMFPEMSRMKYESISQDGNIKAKSEEKKNYNSTSTKNISTKNNNTRRVVNTSPKMKVTIMKKEKKKVINNSSPKKKKVDNKSHIESDYIYPDMSVLPKELTLEQIIKAKELLTKSNEKKNNDYKRLHKDIFKEIESINDAKIHELSLEYVYVDLHGKNTLESLNIIVDIVDKQNKTNKYTFRGIIIDIGSKQNLRNYFNNMYQNWDKTENQDIVYFKSFLKKINKDYKFKVQDILNKNTKLEKRNLLFLKFN